MDRNSICGGIETGIQSGMQHTDGYPDMKSVGNSGAMESEVSGSGVDPEVQSWHGVTIIIRVFHNTITLRILTMLSPSCSFSLFC